MIMSILSGLWVIAQWAFFLGLALLIVVVLMGLFHPIRFDARLRLSILAQKCEVLLTYFFGLVTLRAVQRPTIQELHLRIAWFERCLYRHNSRDPKPRRSDGPDRSTPSSPSSPSSPSAPPGTTVAPLPDPVPTAPRTVTPEPEPSSEAISHQPPSRAPVPMPSASPASPPIHSVSSDSPDPSSTPLAPSALPDPSDPNAPMRNPPTELPAHPHAAAGIPESPISSSPSPDKDVSGSLSSHPEIHEEPEPFKPDFREDRPGPGSSPSSPEKTDPDPKTRKAAGENDSEGFGARVRALRRRSRAAWKQVKRWYARGLSWYERFSPIAKDWFWNLISGFEIVTPALRMRYGFVDYPHLLGMTQGLLCQTDWLFSRWSVRTDFSPVFSANTLLLNSRIGLSIRPWKISWAFFRLLFEKEFRSGLRELYHWYRSRSAAEKDGAKEKQFS
jgi:hypothetical protein